MTYMHASYSDVVDFDENLHGLFTEKHKFVSVKSHHGIDWIFKMSSFPKEKAIIRLESSLH